MRLSRNIVALTATLGLTVAACGTSGEPAGAPTSESSPAEASPSPAESAVPSDWQAISVDIAQLYAPPDWVVTRGGKQIRTLRAPNNEVGLSPGAGHLAAGVFSTGGEVKAELERFAEISHDQFKADSSLIKVERFPNETINGSLFYHFRAESEYTWEDHYGTLVPDAVRQVTVTWKFNKSAIDRKEAEALIEPIMATYEVL